MFGHCVLCTVPGSQWKDAAQHAERSWVAGEPVVAQHVREADSVVQPPRPRRALRGRQEHLRAAYATQQPAEQLLADAPALADGEDSPVPTGIVSLEYAVK